MPVSPNKQKQSNHRKRIGGIGCVTKWIIACGIVVTGLMVYLNILLNIPLSAPEDYLLAPHLTAGKDNEREDDSYDVAILKLRCFATPGCFPSIKCRKGSPKKIHKRPKFEEQSFCADDLQLDSNSQDGKCLVYSFGIYLSWEWEEKVARIFGCEVHAFDPTMNHPTDLAPGVTFHQLGLQGADTNMSATHSGEYNAIESHRLLSLEEIRSKLGHHNRSIDVLTFDCEGCEWGVLNQLVCNDAHYVKQIMTEFHFQKNLGLHDEKHVRIAAEAVSCLEKDRWGVTSIEETGAGPKDWEFFKGVSSVTTSSHLLILMSLRRLSPPEKLPHELIDDYTNAVQAVWAKKGEYAKKIGKNETMWPDDIEELIQRKERVSNELWRVNKNRKVFDENKDNYVEEKDA